MTQQEVYNLIKKTKIPLTTKEIAQKLNMAMAAASRNLRILRRKKEVKFEKKLIRSNWGYVYRGLAK
jgi:Mn-dependent DtxR family transcriptional regulator